MKAGFVRSFWAARWLRYHGLASDWTYCEQARRANVSFRKQQRDSKNRASLDLPRARSRSECSRRKEAPRRQLRREEQEAPERRLRLGSRVPLSLDANCAQLSNVVGR